MTTNPAKHQIPAINMIKLSQIRIDVKQNARTVADAEAIKELATSMKREGQLQAVRVEKLEPPVGEYQYDLVFGYRRTAAAHMLNWTDIRAEVVTKMAPADRAIANLLENLGRENLTTYDQAMAFNRLQKDHGLNGTNIAHSVGKGVSYVNNLIRIVEGLHEAVLERWKQECTPNFGKDADTGKRLPNIHSVCTTEWLGKLVARVPRSEQEHELKIALGLIVTDDEEGGDGGEEGGGDAGGTVSDAPRRATMKQLEWAMSAAEAKSKEVKGEELNQVKVVISVLKYAMGKTQSIKLIGFTNPKPGEGPPKAEKEKVEKTDKKK